MGEATQAAQQYDGCSAEALERRLGASRVELFEIVESTQDVGHALGADDAPSGTVILANAQSAGRGRFGRSWQSEAGRGIWLTMVARPADLRALDVLSIRIGLAAAQVLDVFSDEPICVKWPNDLYRSRRKLGGILLEARWRDSRLEWLAVGFGLNVRPPDGEPSAIGLIDSVTRVEVLERVVPAIRDAIDTPGHLSPAELDAFSRRDLANGRRARAPFAGIVRGIDAGGTLLLDTPNGRTRVRTGSLVLEEE